MSCPEGQVFDIDTGVCVEDTTAVKPPASALQLAFYGALAGVTVGLFLHVAKGKRK
jgi:hypothetical protein